MSSKFDHGVDYSPSTRTATIPVTKLQDPALNISYIRLQWVDLINNIRCRVMPLPYFLKLLESSRPGVGVAKVCLGLVYLMTAPGFAPAGEYLYVPDLSTIRICPYSPGEASVMGWFEEKTPYPGVDNKLTVEVPLCPRGSLQRVLKQSSSVGIDFLVGFESEFILLKSTKPVQAASYHSWTATNGFPSGSVVAKTLKEIADGIQASGIELQMYHAEAAPGQFEMVTGPLPPLEAADALVHTREIIYNTAAKYGLRATFAPRIYMDSAGSSAHTHISVHSKNDQKVPEKLSPVEASFLASLLINLPAVTALTLPTQASYKRMADGVWSGGTYVNWGTENREAPVRLSNATSPSSRNFECRFIDGTANPYLALAATIGTGLAGIRDNVELTVKDCPGPQTAAQMTEEQRQALGITQRMALTWDQARRNLGNNKLLRDFVLGPQLTEKFLAVNQTLADALNLDGDDEAASLTRLVEFY
ncbi:putative glutamine synthetase [Lyophyllum shimeji]|uniref:Glutamine synthetase n=1 Tax=Lyophyllum shimeji TaxID=47721 RepID=A0A9P3PK70_LYOSH|nr:putative glutamine synthetase [Lyophyllum shimeji]